MRKGTSVRGAAVASAWLALLAAAAAGEAACTRDEDCRAYSASCDVCSCVAVPAGAPDPFCPGELVECRPAACSGRRAYCDLATGACAIACLPGQVCGAGCCPLGATCPAGACVLADIYPDGSRAAPFTATRTFAASACELDPVEGPCIAAAGKRRLLRFDTDTPNVGAGDLFLGDPAANPQIYEYSPCHGHFHFTSYAAYELYDKQGRLVADGGKRAFCLEDIRNLTGPPSARYTCDFQGIQAGWSDVYSDRLSCQWIDVTCVPAGDYDLRIALNYEGLLAESDYANNEALVPVSIAAPTCLQDSDCRAYPITCDGQCRCAAVLAECAAPLPCTSGTRRCLRPCRGRQAVCSGGRCALR